MKLEHCAAMLQCYLISGTFSSATVSTTPPDPLAVMADVSPMALLLPEVVRIARA